MNRRKYDLNKKNERIYQRITSTTKNITHSSNRIQIVRVILAFKLYSIPLFLPTNDNEIEIQYPFWCHIYS